MLLQRVGENLAELDRQLVTQKACSRLELEGGWCATFRVPAIQSDEDLAIDLLRETGILVHPGSFYDIPRDHLVLSFVQEPALQADAYARLRRCVEKLGG